MSPRFINMNLDRDKSNQEYHHQQIWEGEVNRPQSENQSMEDKKNVVDQSCHPSRCQGGKSLWPRSNKGRSKKTFRARE